MLALMRRKWRGYLKALIGVVVVTFIYRALIFRQLLLTDVYITTVASSYLLIVLIVASKEGHGPSIFASLISTFCFNFFFLPPPFTITAADPHNWVALTSFLLTAIVASQLWSTAQSRTQEAVKSREDIWKLYRLSRTSMGNLDPDALLSSIARKVQDVFQVGYCAVFEAGDKAEWQPLSIASSQDDSFTPSFATIKEVSVTGKLKSFRPGLRKAENGYRSESARNNTLPGSAITYLPLPVGTGSRGVMILGSAKLEEKTMEAIAGLVAWTIERARILEEIRETVALKQSNELKSALLASVSHDLRTPLTSIRVSVDNLLRGEANWDEDALREFHLIISEEVARLTRLIENLLAMARIEAGQPRLSKNWEQVSDVCHNVLDRCAKAIRHHQVSFECNETLPIVMIDSRLIAEALSNLIENAAKYSPPGSKIVLKAGMKSDYLVISVTDQGPGVAPQDTNHLFEKFYRGTHPQEKGGTGMGLAIAKGIIEAHDGRIWAESLPGKGATFAFSLLVAHKPLVEADPLGASNA